MLHQIIRDRLRAEISRKGISAVELARNSGVKTSFIYDILNGKSTNPSTVKLAAVALALGVDLTYLAGSADAADSPPHMPKGCVAIPRLHVKGAGKAGGEVATDHTEHCFLPQEWVKERLRAKLESLRMLQVSGNTMIPALCNNDIIVIDTAKRAPSPAGIFVLFDGMGLEVRRLELVSNASPQQVRIIADNKQYGAYDRPLKDTQIVGRVVWFSREV